MRTKFQDLNLSNYFLFAAAAENAETSRLLLETLLGIQTGARKETFFRWATERRACS